VTQPVVKGVRYFLAHAPGLVPYGSKPVRELRKDPSLESALRAHLRSYADAATYPPHRVFLGDLDPAALAKLPRPWFAASTGAGQRRGPFGEIMPEEEFLALLKIVDAFDLVWLEEEFVRDARERLAGHPLITPDDLARLGSGVASSRIEAQLAPTGTALPLRLADGRVVGCVHRAHEEDPSLDADILLENLACKATAAMALRDLLADGSARADRIDYVIGSGEEAVGDRYQRGGGNLAKAVAEVCGCVGASGADVKAFCCGPVHAMVVAGALVASGVFGEVAVVGGCSLAKLGMKFQGHLKNDFPILEDVLAGVAIAIGPDDGASPVLRLDLVGRHPVGAGSAQQTVFEQLVAAPLARRGWRFDDVDKYATELHNPEITEPAGSGNVPLLNYRIIASLAAIRGEIGRDDVPAFMERHGMPGFSPTQGHIASAVPYLGHALRGIRAGSLRNTMFLAKGSLFLGRMTQMSDGLSFVLDCNPSAH
jgi:betaine reductase